MVARTALRHVIWAATEGRPYKMNTQPMPSQLSPGTKLGRYAIRSLLGEGGMGVSIVHAT